MDDKWEVDYSLKATEDDSDEDPDLDQLTNIEEYNQVPKTNPKNWDSDYDSMDDGWEVDYGLKPTVDDADSDFDSDGLSNLEEYTYRTKPNNNDTDGDGLLDGMEVWTYGTNPLSADTDGDGFSDSWEIDNNFPADNPVVGLQQYAIVNWWMIVGSIAFTFGLLLVSRKYLEYKLSRTHHNIMKTLDEIHQYLGELKDIGGRRVIMEIEAAEKRIDEIETIVTRLLEEAQLLADSSGSTRYRERIDLYTMTLTLETKNTRDELGISGLLDPDIDT
jgi:hypothetical protein